MSSIESDLVGHWKLDQLVDGGKVVTDESGQGRDGAVRGKPQVAEGKLRSGVLFRGGDEQIVFEDLETVAPATIAFWFNSRELVNDRVVLSQLSGPESQAGALRFSGIVLQVWSGTAWLAVIDQGLRFDSWQHASVVFDGKSATGFLNSREQATVGSGFDFKCVKAGLACKLFARFDNPYIGRLHDLRLYRTALRSQEISELFTLSA